MIEAIKSLNSAQIHQDLDTQGYAHVPGFLTTAQCDELAALYEQPNGFRKTVAMERHRFGLGEYKYFDYPLPPLVQTLREQLYSLLVPIANRWMKQLRIDRHFPSSLMELQDQCHAAGQCKPTPLVLKYGAGGFNTLHQDLYGEVYFPLQAVLMLNQVGVDYHGGEFVITQQVPRAQSKAIVLTPNQGDMVIFTTNFRPAPSARGYHRVSMKHGISEVREGIRRAAGIIFHDARN